MSQPTLTDREFEDIKRLINATIHELVMACHHAEEDQLEEAQNALMTAQGNLDRVAEGLVNDPSSATGREQP